MAILPASISARIRQPVEHRRAGGLPGRDADADAQHRALVLARALDHEDRDAARQKAVAGERHAALLVAVHARNRDHARHPLPGLVSVRQVKPSRQRLAVERDPGRLDLMVRQLGIFEIALPLLLIEEDVLGVVLVDRPLRSAPEVRGHEKVVARADLVLLLRRFDRPRFPPSRHRFECRRDIGEFLHARADRRDVGGGLRTQRRRQSGQARLIPVDAVRTDDVVEDPALLVEAPHGRCRHAIGSGGRRCLGIERGQVGQPIRIGGARRGRRGGRLRKGRRLRLRGLCAGGGNGNHGCGLNESTTVDGHGHPPLLRAIFSPLSVRGRIAGGTAVTTCATASGVSPV